MVNKEKMSIPNFKDIVNMELKPFNYEAFHITIELCSMKSVFIISCKSKYTRGVPHRASMWVRRAHFCGWSLPVQVGILAYTIRFEEITSYVE